MSKKTATITPFEIGVISALTIIGTTIAGLNPALRDKIKDAIEDQLASVPEGDSSDVSGHLPLKALLGGLYPKEKSEPQG